MQCKDCVYLDLTQKTSVCYVCTNKTRDRRGNGKLAHIKAKTQPACKTGFKPKTE